MRVCAAGFLAKSSCHFVWRPSSQKLPDTPFGRGNLALIAVDLARLANSLGVRRLRRVLLVDVTANLNARIERLVAQHVELQLEVAERPLAEKRVRAPFHRRPDDHAVVDLVLRRAPFDLPAVERLAVE